ncbi:MAG TPA: polysaccharide deacetylase family protein [Lacipirellulaceae bacterium]|nr:polysaccharide deacetylase family protein [Lacipirellulaceae bacterium]
MPVKHRWLIVWLACMASASVAFCDEPAAGQKKYLIIHADDAGMSHSVNRATIEAMERGIVSSASILVPPAWFGEFADYARKHQEKDYGIHLTLTSEWEFYRWGPVAPREQVPSLVDREGYLWDNVALVMQHVKTKEAELELRAQINRARQFGVPLSHLDTHMGALFSRPDLVEVYVKLGLEFDLLVLFIREISPPVAREYPALASRGQAMIERLKSRRFPLLDNIGQFYDGDSHEERHKSYINFLRDLPAGVSELIIHCGYDDKELRAITDSASRRDGDRRIFTDPATIALVKDLGIEVISWKQFREMQR